MMLHIKKKVLLVKRTNHNGSTFYIPHNYEGSLTKAPKFKNGLRAIYRKASEEEVKKYFNNKI